MDYSKLVPSRELCEEMQRLNICQSEPELYWLKHPIDDAWDLFTGNPIQEHKCIAPTLSRMMEEFPSGFMLSKCQIKGEWCVERLTIDELTRFIEYTDTLPNAVAKALIAFKKESEN